MSNKRSGGSASSGGGDDGRRGNRPPDKHKIKPGEIRNPHGRRGNPKPAPPPTSIDELYLSASQRVVSRDEHGDVSAVQRLIQEEYRDAFVKEDAAVRLRLLNQTQLSASKAEQETQNALASLLTYQSDLNEAFYRAKKAGRTPPDAMNPDHVHVRDNALVLTGPVGPEERATWEHTKGLANFAARAHQRARTKFSLDPSEQNKAELKAAEAHRRRVMRAVPKGWNWRENIYCRGSWTKFIDETIATLERLS